MFGSSGCCSRNPRCGGDEPKQGKCTSSQISKQIRKCTRIVLDVDFLMTAISVLFCFEFLVLLRPAYEEHEKT